MFALYNELDERRQEFDVILRVPFGEHKARRMETFTRK